MKKPKPHMTTVRLTTGQRLAIFSALLEQRKQYEKTVTTLEEHDVEFSPGSEAQRTKDRINYVTGIMDVIFPIGKG